MAWDTDADLTPMSDLIPATVMTWGADYDRATKHKGEIQVSPAEVELVIALHKLGIKGWEQQKQVGPYYVDFMFEPGLAVEVDGKAYHEDEERERTRDAYLLEHGVKGVYHVRALDVFSDATEVVRNIGFEVQRVRRSA